MTTHTDNGFVWTQSGQVPHMKKDGSETVLLVWKAACVVCGGEIICRTPVDFSTSKAFGLRRCDAHKGRPRPDKAK